ncbi:hypothetical protein SAM23877_p061 (plasmid) [Streptomyces ambofaciens ATCC 23877]|uniref:Uncharacterized protein n=1 Tax=Streptomyces ambofaciens (strain ATCC 23877 / 3486 / DSM 40053 / JCM 4204 / NBRC 12836 / NRRL B-2516) TaxID=278992 RepID=A0A0K2B5T9_STRA7|nr:hypothetical protein [Streptomyces ambofaciens]AKZ60770.1 hypothetical protein SAM23877_p061 [Streptomyces ambofaciens ATCC 23877]
MATRTRNANKQTAKKTTPRARKTTTKARPKNTPVNATTIVDLREPLPVRRRVFVGPMGAQEQAAARAALASATARLPIPVRTWHGPTARLNDGTVITHTPAHATTDHTPTFHAAIRCPHGAAHVYTIHTAQELHRARQITALCDQRTDTAPTPAAPNPAVRALGDALTRARSAAADTQPLSHAEIAAVLTARADQDQPKEHPQP